MCQESHLNYEEFSRPHGQKPGRQRWATEDLTLLCVNSVWLDGLHGRLQIVLFSQPVD